MQFTVSVGQGHFALLSVVVYGEHSVLLSVGVENTLFCGQ